MAKEKYEHDRIVNAIYNEVYSMDVEQLIAIAVKHNTKSIWTGQCPLST